MKLFSVCEYLLSSFIIFVCCLQQCCLGQSTTVRPYKFGFTIDQQQHRSEQRDERGIVMGEFGFITADGIYHVTVYATDEQGRFRILAMKSYPYETPPKTVEVMVKAKIPPKPTTTPKPLPKHNFKTVACSGCFLTNEPKGDNEPQGINGVEGKTVKQDAKTFPNVVSKSAVGQKPANGTPPTASKAATPINSNSMPKSETSTKVPPPIMDIIMQKVLPNILHKKGQAAPPSTPTQSRTPNGKANAKPINAQKPSTSSSGFDTIKRTGGSSADVNGNGDLYRFKYILNYQGHSETGKRNGDKEGNYYAIGDDNVQRSIEYVANEFGYQPRVRWRKLDANEIKSKENTLKDYEFVWFKQ